jgi:hypothetical protein
MVLPTVPSTCITVSSEGSYRNAGQGYDTATTVDATIIMNCSPTKTDSAFNQYFIVASFHISTLKNLKLAIDLVLDAITSTLSSSSRDDIIRCQTLLLRLRSSANIMANESSYK